MYEKRREECSVVVESRWRAVGRQVSSKKRRGGGDVEGDWTAERDTAGNRQPPALSARLWGDFLTSSRYLQYTLSRFQR